MEVEIKHAAVIATNGMIFIGKCHADCIEKMHNISLRPRQESSSQGFLTSMGLYVDRFEAMKIAKLSGQVNDTQENKSNVLFSEDLWSKEHGGEYYYCEIRGYCKGNRDYNEHNGILEAEGL